MYEFSCVTLIVSLNLQLQKSAAFVLDVFSACLSTITGPAGSLHCRGLPICGPIPAV